MIKIKLFCAAGFSTSLLADKMKKAADAKNIEVDVEACSQGQMADCLDDADVMLLGPQVAYTLPKSKEICAQKGVPVDVIPMADYGRMNGEKVLEFALNLLKK
ncbi:MULTISPECIES: PTS sugar transporter subunit IIB [Tissierellales]|jgi:PTS system cellobiose-specific IIB component|uniref:PTS sugar transporter subunit IIB n=1 Tax=Acidilutibacter cellobiosedens TaxID=2507161 RepID=A0A410Q9N1_9FIRM|nr:MULTISPECIES: PTS sugar transporter subunit IIB [Tissierellales]QAT60703.1 PTS sugar transporter subunit IIB [Acidilutibacter cellobiosedens]SCL91473.1 Lichenan-specific phosphotransferase enzyme IIB component [Sporanaerobacter sp. PP17-6a]